MKYRKKSIEPKGFIPDLGKVVDRSPAGQWYNYDKRIMAEETTVELSYEDLKRIEDMERIGNPHPEECDGLADRMAVAIISRWPELNP